MEMKMKIRFAALLVLLVAPSALADQAFDACVRKLCKGPGQSDCWVKAGAAMCDQGQIGCKTLPDHAGARVKRKAGSRWEVETDYGKGWVSDRMMMVSGDKC